MTATIPDPLAPPEVDSYARIDGEDPPARRYEAAKRVWVQTHPHATPQEYEAAMQIIAREVGL